MKRLFRWILRLGVGVVLLGIILLLVKDALIKEFVQWRLRKETGCDVSIGRLEISLLKPTVLMENFRLFQPPELGSGVFLSMPELRLEYDPRAARRRELHFKSAVLNVAEVNLVSGPNKKTLLDVLQERGGKKEAGSDVNFTGIDTLTLTLGRIRESSLNGGPVVERNLGITNRVLRNVRSAADLTPLLMDLLLRQLGPETKPVAPR